MMCIQGNLLIKVSDPFEQSKPSLRALALGKGRYGYKNTSSYNRRVGSVFSPPFCGLRPFLISATMSKSVEPTRMSMISVLRTMVF